MPSLLALERLYCVASDVSAGRLAHWATRAAPPRGNLTLQNSHRFCGRKDPRLSGCAQERLFQKESLSRKSELCRSAEPAVETRSRENCLERPKTVAQHVRTGCAERVLINLLSFNHSSNRTRATFR
jgi:hypothetical protein